MHSTVIVEIDAPLAMVADLFADPSKNAEWMDDVKRFEPIGGEQGMPGSTYRLVPKKGSMVFVATVVSRSLAADARGFECHRRRARDPVDLAGWSHAPRIRGGVYFQRLLECRVRPAGAELNPEGTPSPHRVFQAFCRA